MPANSALLTDACVAALRAFFSAAKTRTLDGTQTVRRHDAKPAV